jgi:hypothetical protein
MTDDHREAGTVYPVFSEVRYMMDDHREAGTVYPRFSVRFVTSRIIRHVANPTENRGKQFLSL